MHYEFDHQRSSPDSLDEIDFSYSRDKQANGAVEDADEHQYSFLDVQTPEEFISSLNGLYVPVENAPIRLDPETHGAQAPKRGPNLPTLVGIGLAVTLGWSAITTNVTPKSDEGQGTTSGVVQKTQKGHSTSTSITSKKNDDPGHPPRPSRAEEVRLSRLNASESCEKYAPDITRLPYGEPAKRPSVSPENAVLHQTLVTFYLPKPFEEYATKEQAKLEGGPNDRRKVPLVTIEEHLRTGKRVSIAMDAKSSFSSIYGYGTEITVYFPGISKIYPQLKNDTFPAVLVDTGCAFSYTYGRKTDVAVKSEHLAKAKSGVGVWWVDGKRKPE